MTLVRALPARLMGQFGRMNSIVLVSGVAIRSRSKLKQRSYQGTLHIFSPQTTPLLLKYFQSEMRLLFIPIQTSLS